MSILLGCSACPLPSVLYPLPSVHRLTVVQFIRRRIVIGRSIMRQGVLLTVMGSIRTDRGDVQGEMAEERRVVQGIVRSFGEA
jgi:hypothetical protein